MGIRVKFSFNQNNNIFLIKNGKYKKVRRIKGLKVHFGNSNNNLYIELPMIKFENSIIEMRGNSHIEIKSSSYKMTNVSIVSSKGNKIIIGNNFSMGDGVIMADADSNIIIGNDCMFSDEIYIRPHDGHCIYDINTKELLNDNKDIIIGNHVWVSNRCTILKGAKVGNNCVVGNSSLVNKKIEKNNCIIAGIPAKVVKENISWDRKTIEEYKSVI